MTAPRRERPTLPLRYIGVGVVAVLSAGALLLLLLAADTALSVWERLNDAPTWLVATLGIGVAGLVAASAWLVLKLLGRRADGPARAPRPAVTREALDARVEKLAGRTEVADVRDALADSDRRAASGEVYVALFGEISTGKTSLMRVLTGDPTLDVDVRGGTTRSVVHARGRLPDGRTLTVADAPGINEAEDRERAALARDEAVKAHVVVFVADGDVTRDQHAELEALLSLGKPTVVALNKSDRYRRNERDALLTKLRTRYGTRAAVVPVSAGGDEEIVRLGADGAETRVVRPRAVEVAGVLDALATLSAEGAPALEPARQRAVLETLAARLDATEAELRAQDASLIVARYTRRAVVGALAAVAPGMDVLIQAGLAGLMLRELAQLHGVALSDVELDRFLDKAVRTVRGAASIALAIAGNALKAFPGLGTITGGLVHAVAYGLIFDALGRAVAWSLAERGTWAPDAALERAERTLQQSGTARLAEIARIAIDAAKGER